MRTHSARRLSKESSGARSRPGSKEPPGAHQRAQLPSAHPKSVIMEQEEPDDDPGLDSLNDENAALRRMFMLSLVIKRNFDVK